MNRARQAWLILLLTGALLLAWAGLARLLPEPQLAETNYQANRLRIERWFLDPTPSNVIVGSSISGRLLPGYFAGTPLASMANLGLDGSGPVTALELVRRKEPLPQRVFVEVHRVDREPDANDRLLLETALGSSTTVARTLPLTRAVRRPSTVLYGWLKEHGGGGGRGQTPRGDERRFATNAPWLPPLQTQVAELRARGCEVILLRLPVGQENPLDAAAPNFADDLARHLGIRLLDLNRFAVQRQVQPGYTDHLHLSPGSARVAAALLAESVVVPR